MRNEPSNVPDASGGSSTRPPAGRARPTLGSPKKYPSYLQRDRELIGEFIAVYQSYCADALRRAEDLHSIDTEDAYARSMIVRWTYGIQVCSWMLSRLQGRQKHLALKAYVAEHGELPP